MSEHDGTTDTDTGVGIDGERLVESFPRASLTPASEYVSVIDLPARRAQTTPTDEVLRPTLASPYPYELFSHQAVALTRLAGGEHVAVTTSTSSGKTHVYGLQIARNLLDAGVIAEDGSRTADANEASTALCVYPMKALTKDQHASLDELYDDLGLDIRVRTYDGDTPKSERRAIREEADVILTNFAALNVYLEHHDQWSRFYGALELVAIDESHTYTGIQGMHVAWILRRMQRVTEYWGGDPQYVLTSATIGNPGEHSQTLINAPVTVIDNDGSPRGARDLVLWNPPAKKQSKDTSPDEQPFAEPSEHHGENTEGIDEEETPIAERVPASVEAPKVFSHLTAQEIQTLLFCPSRKLTELSVQRAKDHRRNNRRYGPKGTAVSIEPYNAGFGRRTRHSREHQFKTGVINGLATTSALELGIDIGRLDATVLMGYPGQRQSFWQRIGRAGRKGRRSLAVMIADHRTLDQYVVNHPEYLLENDVEDAVVDTSNNAVFATHVLCAAAEIALDESDVDEFADEDRVRAAVRMWREAGYIDGYLDAAAHYAGPGRPQTRVNLYGTDQTDFQLQLADTVDPSDHRIPDGLDLEPVARNRAYRDYHEGAVRLLGGRQFEVVDVDEDRPQPVIKLEPVDREYYTQTRYDVNVLDADSERSREQNGFALHFGRGTVLVHHHSYDQKYIRNGDAKELMIPTGNPPILMETQLCWIEVPEAVETALVRKYRDYGVETGVDPDDSNPPHLGYVAGLHAAEHATIQTAPLELRVDKQDIGGLATLVLDTHFAQPHQEDMPGATGTSLEAAKRTLEQRSRELGERSSSGWFIYDGVEGGLGFARAVYENFEALAERARDQLRDCRCGRPNGCPACTFDENCGNDNTPLLRESAVDVLEQFLGNADREDIAEYLPEDEYGGERRPVLFYS
ncbi:MAG: DEAD/DEAH box helicase [Halobacteriota archaeon]|uniref:DEAD/DEAH box helicase n=1 Tax=Natronomonas sp. TaxID=2184060 RepID=UPI003976091F